jgi:hypothetical protein
MLGLREGSCTGPTLECWSVYEYYWENYGEWTEMTGVWFWAGQQIAIIVDGKDASDQGDYQLSLRVTDAVLPPGAPCETTERWVYCEEGTSCVDDGTGVLRCAVPQCSNGVDEDGDLLVDWPNDPGCSSELDNTEDSPIVTACSNGLDDDLDGFIDFPEDPECGSASGESESFCATPILGALGSAAFPVRVEGATLMGAASAFSTQCGYADEGAPDALYQFTAPADGVYQIDTYGTPNPYGSNGTFMLSVRDAACDGAELACDAEGTGWDGEMAAILHLPLVAHQTVAIVVDGIQGNWGEYVLRISQSTIKLPLGAPCEPLSAATCVAGTCLPDGAGAHVCAIAACGNGRDDDGDGLADWPNDPGCTSLDDDDEANPAVAPVCSNAADDDADLAADFPADTGCGGASGLSENFCPGLNAQLLVGAPLQVRGWVSGPSKFVDPWCAGYGPEVAYEWVVPVTGMYWIDTMGSAVTTKLALRNGGCTGQYEACDYYRSGGAGTSLLQVSLTAGQHLSIVVDTDRETDVGETVLNIRTVQPPYCESEYVNGRYIAPCWEPLCAWRPACLLGNPTAAPSGGGARRRRHRRRARRSAIRSSPRGGSNASRKHT